MGVKPRLKNLELEGKEIRLWEELLGNCDNSVLWIRNGGSGTNLREAVSSGNLDIVWTGWNTKFGMICSSRHR